MHTVFVDTDVVIDFLTQRNDESEDAMRLFDLAVKKEITVCISTLSISNLHHILRKLFNDQKAREAVKAMLLLCEVLPVAKSTLDNALASPFSDFEDGIQHACAEEAGIHVIVTRNLKDYKSSRLSVMAPKAFLATL